MTTSNEIAAIDTNRLHGVAVLRHREGLVTSPSPLPPCDEVYECQRISSFPNASTRSQRGPTLCVCAFDHRRPPERPDNVWEGVCV